jgi:hypothetical protein
MQTAIHVQDFHGDRVVDDQHQLPRVLSQRYSDDANLFTFSDKSLAYPWLYAYVRKDLAVLYYLPTAEEMFASAGDMGCDKGVMKFYDNEASVNWLPASAVISWSRALVCIEEFCSNLGRPIAIEWRRLS